MAFYSILFETPEAEAQAKIHPWLTLRKDRRKNGEAYVLRGNKMFAAPKEMERDAPEFPGAYLDIHLDQIMEAVLCRDTDADLKEVFYHFCPDEASVMYRHEVMKALAQAETGEAFHRFHQTMDRALRLFAYGSQARHAAQRDKYLLDGAALYCDALHALLQGMCASTPSSRGVGRFLDALQAYVREPGFAALEARIRHAKESLERISYRLRVGDGSVQVDFEAGGGDCAQALAADFEVEAKWDTEMGTGQREILLFRQVELNPLETLILQAIMQHYPEAFRKAQEAAALTSTLPEPFIRRFSRELTLYFRYLDFMNRIREKGLDFAYPDITKNGMVALTGVYDLALAIQAESVVSNDFDLLAEEKGAVITGANQGGKTTFARSIGQIAALAALGLPVPCKSARLPLYTSIFTQFTEAEDATVDNGKLKEELLRLKPVLQGADRGSLVILNELFSSATAQDAMDMAHHTLERLLKAEAQVVCVTHVEGLCIDHTVSMVAQIQKSNGKRLFTILRAPADGHAYADGIAQKYHLTFREIKERIGHGI